MTLTRAIAESTAFEVWRPPQVITPMFKNTALRAAAHLDWFVQGWQS